MKMKRLALALALVAIAFATGFVGAAHAYNDYHYPGWSTVVTDVGGNEYQITQWIFYWSHTNDAIDLDFARGEMSVYGTGDKIGCATADREWSGGIDWEVWVSPNDPFPVTSYAYVDFADSWPYGNLSKTGGLFKNSFSANGWYGPPEFGNCQNQMGAYDGHGWLSWTNAGTTSWTDILEHYSPYH
ncbi:MAG: hypothetical protein HY681_01825 [Chloroflexi bacterium]|nr:hypothetical protein [Chloroflexota bacterium]